MKRLIALLVTLLVVILSLAGCGKSRVARAEELLNSGSKTEAAKLLSDEISDHPKNAEAYFVYGKVLLEDNRHDAYERFRSAIKVNKNSTSKIEELLSKEPTYSDLCFLADIDPDIMKRDADLCYKYRVVLSGNSYDALMFAEAFPDDKRSPRAMEITADGYKKNGSSDLAQHLFRKIVNKYPKSKEAKRAKELLSDWWRKDIINLQLDGRWHARSVQKGQKYRYTIRGEVTRDTAFGIMRINADNVWVFEGTQPELSKSQRQSFGVGDYFYRYEGPKARKADRYGSGIAAKDCYIWFIVPGSEFNNSLIVEFEVKE